MSVTNSLNTKGVELVEGELSVDADSRELVLLHLRILDLDGLVPADGCADRRGQLLAGADQGIGVSAETPAARLEGEDSTGVGLDTDSASELGLADVIWSRSIDRASELREGLADFVVREEAHRLLELIVAEANRRG